MTNKFINYAIFENEIELQFEKFNVYIDHMFNAEYILHKYNLDLNIWKNSDLDLDYIRIEKINERTFNSKGGVTQNNQDIYTLRFTNGDIQRLKLGQDTDYKIINN